MCVSDGVAGGGPFPGYASSDVKWRERKYFGGGGGFCGWVSR